MRPEPFLPIYDLTNIPTDEELALDSARAQGVIGGSSTLGSATPPFPWPIGANPPVSGTSTGMSDQEFLDMLQEVKNAEIQKQQQIASLTKEKLVAFHSNFDRCINKDGWISKDGTYFITAMDIRRSNDAIINWYDNVYTKKEQDKYVVMLHPEQVYDLLGHYESQAAQQAKAYNNLNPGCYAGGVAEQYQAAQMQKNQLHNGILGNLKIEAKEQK